MDFKTEINESTALTAEKKKKQLFQHQKELLDAFLAHHAITQQQYDKSLHDLTEKMRMGSLESSTKQSDQS